MSVQLREVGAAADLTVDVPRDAAGNLKAGVTTVLRRADAVETVDDVDVTDLTPRLNDLRATVTAEVTVAVERAEETAVRAALGDAFGVTVEGVAVERPPP